MEEITTAGLATGWSPPMMTPPSNDVGMAMTPSPQTTPRKAVFNGWNARAAIALQLAGPNTSFSGVVDVMCADEGVTDYTPEAARGALDRLCDQEFATKTGGGQYNLTIEGHRLAEMLRAHCPWREATFLENHRRWIIFAVLKRVKGKNLTADEMATKCGMSRDSCRRGANELVKLGESKQVKRGRSFVYWIEVVEEPDADLDDDNDLPPVPPTTRFLEDGDEDDLDSLLDDDLPPTKAEPDPLKTALDVLREQDVARQSDPSKPVLVLAEATDTAKVRLHLPVSVVQEASVQAAYAGLGVEDYLEQVIKARSHKIAKFVKAL
jgi:predicted transcriptional regulator